MALQKLGNRKIGVDLGTATILIEVEGRGIVLEEPSVVAVHKKTGKVLAVGQEAKNLLGRTPETIEAIRPLREGVISDFEATELLLKIFLGKTMRGKWEGFLRKLLKPEVLVCVPSVVSPVERRAVEESCQQAGMGRVHLIREPIAAALGAGLDLSQAKGHLVVDIGGGTTDICVISMGEAVSEATLRVAGDVLDESIIRYLRRNFDFLIGEKTAEQLKQKLGSALPPEEEELVQERVRGRNLKTGLPGELWVDKKIIYDALIEPLNHILESLRSVLEQTPPDLLADLAETGCTLTGGGALLNKLDQWLEQQSGLRTRIAEDPIRCVVKGTALAFEHLDQLDELQSWKNR